MISRMRDQKLWKNERVFELGKRAIIPSVSEVAATPWFGLNQIYSYSSGGQVNAQFHQMLDGSVKPWMWKSAASLSASLASIENCQRHESRYAGNYASSL